MSDVAFPRLHVRAQSGWVNDPNGLCRVDGRWHVFYQYNPAGPWHAQIHWGHSSSADLVHWREEPVALAPRPGGPDSAGCWSGCCTVDDGVPTLCYTAVAGHPRDAVALIATGDPSLTRWTPATEPSAGREGPADAETRDPFVVWIEGRRYVIQGFGGPSSTAQVLVYDATDLRRWRLLGPLIGADDPVAARIAAAEVWECPSLVRIDGRWVLTLSLLSGHPAGVRWLTGDLVVTAEGPRFTAVDGGVLDGGPAFYAPQLLDDRNGERTEPSGENGGGGRILMWGWSYELGRSQEWLDAHGWAGTLTTPRELRMVGGRLVSSPAEEYLTQRSGVLGGSWRAVEHPAFQVLTGSEARLICSAPDPGSTADGGPGEGLDLPAGAQVLVDGSLVEVFGPDGATFTTRIYPSEDSVWSIEGQAEVNALG